MAGGEYNHFGEVVGGLNNYYNADVRIGVTQGYSGWGEYTVTPIQNSAWNEYRWQQPMQPFQPFFTEEAMRVADGWDADENS